MIKFDLMWSPHREDEFLLIGEEMHLYRVSPWKESDVETPVFWRISASTGVELLNSVSVSLARCFQWHPKPEYHYLGAAGHANGRVMLMSPYGEGVSSAEGSGSLLGCEFMPKHSRQCLCLAWNPAQTQLLAAGFDRYRSEYSVLIWDVFSRLTGPGASAGGGGTTAAIPGAERRYQADISAQWQYVGSDFTRIQSGISDHGAFPPPSSSSQHGRALYEFGAAEAVHSLLWQDNSRSLICGFSNKYIRVFDIRDFYRHHISIPTKATYGVCVDPFSDWCIAAHHETVVQLWDLRHCDKPLLMMNEPKPVIKLQWNPVKSGTLACLCRDADVVKVFHLQRVMSDDAELCFSDCYIQSYFPNACDDIVTFTWYPRRDYRLLLASGINRFQDVFHHENCCLSWHEADLLVSVDGTLTECVGHSAAAVIAGSDISAVMKRRAFKDYGVGLAAILHDRLARSELFGSDPTLKWLWDWIEFVKDAMWEDDDSTESGETTELTKFPGVIGILCSDRTAESAAKHVPLDPADGQFSTTTVKMYFSEQREKILQLCGWGGNSQKSDRFAAVDPFLHSLCSRGEIERAAAIALFTGRLQLSVKILNKSVSFAEHGRNLQLFALGLSGFQNAAAPATGTPSAEKHDEQLTDLGSLWSEVLAAMLPNIQNPHLKAMFCFLSCVSSGSSLQSIFEIRELAIRDKVAIAALYLPDAELYSTVEMITDYCTEQGDLSGILCTGISREGPCIELLQSYIDRTSDVQTAALVLLFAGCLNTAGDQKDAAYRIVDSYYELLNYWRLWHTRAQLENLARTNDVTSHPTKEVECPPQIYLTCSFCGKPACGPPDKSRQKQKVGSCFSCKKTLPRCSLCGVHLGTQLPSCYGASDKCSKFGSWFAWCQTCRHGGHTEHLATWFESNSECPVTGCTCRCASLDDVLDAAHHSTKSSMVS